MMRTSTAVDATLISAPSSTKNADGQRAPEMKQTEKGNNWHFSMKTRIGVDAQSGLVRTVAGTAANVNNLNVAGSLHGEEGAAIGDAGYQDVNSRPDAAGSCLILASVDASAATDSARASEVEFRAIPNPCRTQ